MSIIPVGENILVKPVLVEQVTEGGIYLRIKGKLFL